jgi:hypothetical protein
MRMTRNNHVQDVADGVFGGAALLKKGLLAAARDDAPLQDRIDCAEIALACGDRESAAALYGLVALELGTSSTTAALIRDVNARASLWSIDDIEGQAHLPGLSIDLAIEELRTLFAEVPSPLWTQDQQLSGQKPEAHPYTPNSIVMLAREASTVLRKVPSALAQRELSALLATITPRLMSLPRIYIEDHLELTSADMAEMFALESLRRFVVRNWELLTIPPEISLADKVACLAPAALGPFFSNVPMLLRNARDFLPLIDAAAGGMAEIEALEIWSLLLSSHLRHDTLRDLIEELGDRGMTMVLRGILQRIALTGLPREILSPSQSIRDAALDIGDLRLAAEAQQIIAETQKHDPNEWQIFGSIQALIGDVVSAEISFGKALALDPIQPDATLRLALMQAGRPFRIEGGISRTMAQRAIRRARYEAFRKERGGKPEPAVAHSTQSA